MILVHSWSLLNACVLPCLEELSHLVSLLLLYTHIGNIQTFHLCVSMHAYGHVHMYVVCVVFVCVCMHACVKYTDLHIHTHDQTL